MIHQYQTPEEVEGHIAEAMQDLLDRIKEAKDKRKDDTPLSQAHYMQKEIDKWFKEHGH